MLLIDVEVGKVYLCQMKRHLKHILLVGILILLTCGNGRAQGQVSSIPELVQSSFHAYREAILEENGLLASEYVSSYTLSYYDRMLFLALSADSLQIDSLSLVDKMTILIFRGTLSPESLKAAGSGDGFIFAINHGLVSKEDIRQNELGTIFYDSTFARAPMVIKGQLSPLQLYFHLEQGTWKLDLTSLFPLTEPVIQRLVNESGMEENEFMQLLVTFTLAGEEQQNALWHPVP